MRCCLLIFSLLFSILSSSISFCFIFKSITGTNLTKDNIAVLGNMCCTLEGSFIENSDSSILEKLNNCPDLTTSQGAAIETLLRSGRTQFGYVNNRSTPHIVIGEGYVTSVAICATKLYIAISLTLFLFYFSLTVFFLLFLIRVSSTWSLQTMKDLSMLNLYLPSTFYTAFDGVRFSNTTPHHNRVV